MRRERSGMPLHFSRHGGACGVCPRGKHGAEATREVDWRDRTRAESLTITITITLIRDTRVKPYDGKLVVVRQAACVRAERARVGEEHDSDAGSTVSGGNPIGEAEANPA